MHFLGAQSNGAAGHIDGHVPATDDGHFRPDFSFAGQVGLSQESDPLADTLGFFSGNTQLNSFMGADRQINRLVSVL